MVKSDWRSFWMHNIAQFFGALNDNVYRFLVVFSLFDIVGVANMKEVVSLCGAMFLIPFLMLSPLGGRLASSYPKNIVLFWTKVLEIVVMLIGVAAFYAQQAWLCYFTLFMMGGQSALFGPSKYSCLPEIMQKKDVPKAHGYMAFFTYFAIVTGTTLASQVAEFTNRNFVVAGLFCVVLAIIGSVAASQVRQLKVEGHQEHRNRAPWYDLYYALSAAVKYPFMPYILVGYCLFFTTASLVQLNAAPFVVEALKMSDTQGGYLYSWTGVGIGLGAWLFGQLSGGKAYLRVLPFSALTIGCSLIGLYAYGADYWTVTALFFLLGFAGGFYFVPIEVYMQLTIDRKDAGEAFAGSGFISFSGALFGALFLYAVPSLSSAEIFLAYGAVMVMTASYLGAVLLQGLKTGMKRHI